MISTFVPISDSFVVAGTSESHVQIIQFPSVDPAHTLSNDYIGNYSQNLFPRSPKFIRPINTSVLGKCSHSSVSEIAHLGEHVAAASANTLSTWDLVKNCRIRHLTTPDQSAACKYIGNKLLAVAGSGQSVHLYDTRIYNKSHTPIWSIKLAKDNLYTLAVEDTTVFAAGADGFIYGVDLRAQQKITWDLRPDLQYSGKSMDFGSVQGSFKSKVNRTNAILDLTVSNGKFVLTLESGHVCGVPLQFHGDNNSESYDLKLQEASENSESMGSQSKVSGGDFLFTTPYASGSVRSRIGCDVLDIENVTHIAVGSEYGQIKCYKYSQESKTISEYENVIDTGSKSIVSCVRWSSRGLCINAEDEVTILPFSSFMR